MSFLDATDTEDVQLVTVRLGVDTYALDILQLRRILRWAPPVPRPDGPAFLEGVLEQGGRALPVVDLRRRLGLPALVTEETRIVVAELGPLEVGMVVDAARGVLRVDSTTITAAPAEEHGLPEAYVAGRLARPERSILVLNPQRLLSPEERSALRSLEST